MAFTRPDEADRKKAIRRCALVSRRRQPNKERLSRRICRTLTSLPEYLQARTVMLYVSVRGEVRTWRLLLKARRQGKRVVVPYCHGDRLGLFCLECLDDLEPGTLGIREPKHELCARGDREVDVAELDLIIVPGVAFDRHGGRLGHGKGYYDELLGRARPDAAIVAFAFECQLHPSLPMLGHDVPMQTIITEKTVYRPGKPS